MAGFEVTSHGATPDDGALVALLDQDAYRQDLSADRSAPWAHLLTVASAQVTFDRVAEQAAHATYVSGARRDALTALRDANLGYASVLCRYFVPPLRLSEVVTQLASDPQALRSKLQSLAVVPWRQAELEEVCSVCRQTLRRIADQLRPGGVSPRKDTF
jgi:hypothetical protein